MAIKTNRKILHTTIALILGTVSINSLAEQVSDNNSGASRKMEVIEVTAQKRSQSINDVGITMNAFGADQLADYGVRSAEDLETLTPGLTITNSQPSGVPVYTIRGVGFADFTTSASSTVGLYFDEASIPYSVMSRGALFDMQRVEVLKGPQGDLYGRNTTAGQINFISNKPTETFEAGVTVDYSSYSTLDMEGFVSGALTNAVNARLSLKRVNSGKGWQQSISRPGDTLGEKDEFAARLLLDINLHDNATLYLNAHYFKDDSDNMAGTPFSITPDDGFGTPPALVGREDEFISTGDSKAADWTEDFRPSRDNKMQGLSAKVEWGFDGVDFTSISSYDKFERNESFDTSGVHVKDADALNTTEIKVFSQELRLSSNNDSDIYWLAGVFYSTDELDEGYLLDFRESALPLDIDTRYQQDTDSIAVFGHVEWQFAEQLKLTLGGRYTSEDRKWSGCTYDTGSGTLAGFWNGVLSPFVIGPNPDLPTPSVIEPGGCAVYNDIAGSSGFGDFGVFSSEINEDEAMWKVTLDYDPNESLLIYGTISTGFKSGGFNGAGAQFHGQLVPYTKEELTSYEIGMKSTILDGDMQLNASAFFYDYNDKQEPTSYISPIGPIVGLTNVPKSEIYGLEAEVSWFLSDELTLDLGVAYLDTEIKEYQAIDTDASTFNNIVRFDASGSELSNSPKWQSTATLSYTTPITGSIEMTLATDVSYKSDNIGSVGVDDESDSDYLTDYTLVNARVRFENFDENWTATLWARNLTDEHYWHSTSLSSGTRIRLNGLPSTYGVTFSYLF